jgi:hypothetical protein
MPPSKEQEKSPMNGQPNKTVTADNALFVATVKIKRGNKLIEQLMSQQDLKDTGVGNLTAPQKAALNAFLDASLVVAPGPKNE